VHGISLFLSSLVLFVFPLLRFVRQVLRDAAFRPEKPDYLAENIDFSRMRRIIIIAVSRETRMFWMKGDRAMGHRMFQIVVAVILIVGVTGCSCLCKRGQKGEKGEKKEAAQQVSLSQVP
jgi:Na+-transporting methylmalonyl-CoA/oxaloacetate decarboxylase gamma subunit